MKRDNKGAVLIEVLVGLFITSLVFIGVYTTISVSLVNTRYLQQARQTSDFASQFTEALMAGADCEEYSVFDFIKDKYGSVSGQTEVDLNEAYQTLIGLEAMGTDTVNFRELINENTLSAYNVQLFLISPNAVYLSEQSVGTPFGSGVYSPDENLLTFELRVQRNSQDWGYNGYSIYKERQPAVISYIFQVYRG
ncbi:MAG: hypothetical protein IJO56_07925 [Oscillospiraceae bacterium]|nr:hypothetical protein [Oscillospiraceae bacterium]